MAEIFDALRRVFGGQRGDALTMLAGDRQKFLNDAADMGAERLDRYGLYEEYFDGERGVPLNDRAKQYLERSGLPYTESPCEVIVLSHKARLRVEGFQVEGNEEASSWLTRNWWGRGRMDGVQGIVHEQTLKLGDGFVIVDYDTGRPRATWNHPCQIKPVYDDGVLQYVSKPWTTSKVSPSNPQGVPIRRLNLYYPDRIEKWFAVGADGAALWAPYLDEDDYVDPDDGQEPEVDSLVPGLVARWPTPWTTTGGDDGDPLGIPVFHFREGAAGRDFGRSILRGVIPLCDALDKQSVDLFAVMDSQGWKQRTAAGVPEGTSLKVAVGEWVTSPDSNARFSEFAAEDPRPLQEILEGTIRRIAVKSRTPLHELLIKGELPSGKALQTANGSSVAAARDRHIDYGNVWEDVGRFAHRLAAAFGTDAPAIEPTAEIDVIWDSPEVRDELAEAQTLMFHQDLGASRASTLRRAGYDPKEEADLRAKEEPAPPSGSVL